MAAEIESLIKDLTSQINAFKPQVEAVDVGEVLEVGDGIARVSGLTNVQSNELVEFANGALGIAFNLEEERVGVIILGEYADIEEGQLVRRTQRIASIPVGDALLGRVVDPLGRPLDGKGPIATSKFRNIERIAPGVIERSNVNRPVQTGIKRRPADGQDRHLPRHDHQSEGSRPRLHLRGHRPEAIGHRPLGVHPRKIRRAGILDHRRRVGV
jgi:F0F1-type ATP synthase alpha subunit